MLSFDPLSVSLKERHQYIIGAVAPRPIAWVSTVSGEGVLNLAPFSFFNAFCSNPPVVVIGPARRGSDATVKDTLNNLREVPELVVNVVTRELVWRMALTSIEYPPEVNEFEKAGLTPVSSVRVKPPRVAQSPVQLECRVRDIITISEGQAGGNMVICDVIYMHIDEKVLNERGQIDPARLRLVGRLNRFWYVEVGENSLFEVPVPQRKEVIGYDRLPQKLKDSGLFTEEELAALACADPKPERLTDEMIEVDARRAQQVKELLKSGRYEEAWSYLLRG